MRALGAIACSALAAIGACERSAPTVEVPTPNVGDDPVMNTWAEQAQAAWSEFVQAFADPQPDSHYSVLIRLENDRGEPWLMPIDVIEIAGDRVRGVIGVNLPLDSGFEHGQSAEFGVNEIIDWTIWSVNTGRIRGGFSREGFRLMTGTDL
ncbi:MAG: hypothetical protein R3B49_11720 [Phycisphaerales bacterium]